MKITILGGTSGFGKWLARMIKNRFGDKVDILITGRNSEKGEYVAKSLGVNFTTNNIEAVKNADITIISVTIGNTKKVINEVGPYLKPGSILADVTSVKVLPYKEMMKFSNKVLVIPTHPMFGPFVSNLSGQVVILTPPEYTKKDTRYKWFKNFLIEEGVRIYEISPEQHDKIMSIIQGLTHFSLFTIGESLRRLSEVFFDEGGNELEMLDNFTSPVYKMLVSLVSRYMGQNPYLYAEIQVSNPLNKKVQEIFIKTAMDFHKIFFDENNIEKFVDIVNIGKQFFGDYAKVGQKYTDKIIFLLSKQIEKIRKNVGKNIKIQNIYNNEIKSGILEKFDFVKITLNGEDFNLDERIIL